MWSHQQFKESYLHPRPHIIYLHCYNAVSLLIQDIDNFCKYGEMDGAIDIDSKCDLTPYDEDREETEEDSAYTIGPGLHP